MADHFLDATKKADYISREAAKAKKIYSVERRELVVPVAEIDWLPAADVVEVVRCKDCIHAGDRDCPIDWPKNGEDYCSFGERRADNG